MLTNAKHNLMFCGLGRRGRWRCIVVTQQLLKNRRPPLSRTASPCRYRMGPQPSSWGPILQSIRPTTHNLPIALACPLLPGNGKDGSARQCLLVSLSYICLIIPRKSVPGDIVARASCMGWMYHRWKSSLAGRTPAAQIATVMMCPLKIFPPKISEKCVIIVFNSIFIHV